MQLQRQELQQGTYVVTDWICKVMWWQEESLFLRNLSQSS